MKTLPEALIELRQLISKMPGFSERGAERFLEWWWQHKNEREDFYRNWGIWTQYKPCQQCYFFALKERCDYCEDDRRDKKKICVLTSPFTVPLIEKEAEYRGLYFILGGDIAGMQNRRSTEEIKERILLLKSRLVKEEVAEVIIATDFTSRGEATSLFIKDVLKDMPVNVSRLARGFHPGDALRYGDPMTLKKAFENRETY